MKVLENNYNEECTHVDALEPYPRELECEKCGSKLEYDKSDMEVGIFGAMHVKCPLCGYNNMLDGNECDVILTKDNVEFPIHFHHTSKENGAVDTCNNKFVRECVQKAINYFRKHKDEFAYCTGTGSTMVYVFRYDGDEDYEVVVTDNHYSTYIPFEEEDYGSDNERVQLYSLHKGE